MADALLHTLIALTCAHLVADFVFQSDAMVRRKSECLVMLGHIAIVTAASAAMLGWLAWPVLFWIAITHLAMDLIKVHVLKAPLRGFAIDQVAHFAVIFGIALAYPDAADRGIWALLPTAILSWFYGILVAISALVAATITGGIVIGLALKPLASPEVGEIGGLPAGGQYIGWLERGLTVVFVLMGEPTGVGLLLAAKSILRFGDIKDTNDRARAEYIMIGTFFSMGWALPIAAIARRIIEHVLS